MLTLKPTSKKQNGFGLAEVVVVLAIMAILLPILSQIVLIPAITQTKALNFQKAELAASLYAMRSAKQGELWEPVPEGCTTQIEDEVLNIHSVQCTVGKLDQVKATAKTNIPLEKVSLFGGDFTDADNDGYEDTTGLPTHYDECYSGWKGNAGSSFKDASCELGGEYVIPMYRDLYL